MNRSPARHPVLALGAVCALAIGLSACGHRAAPASAADGSMGAAIPPATGSRDDRGGAGTGYIAGSAEDFSINVGDRVYFDLDSHQIRTDAFSRLDAQATWLQRYPGVNIRIEGNADERGTREYNLALGARRAEAVRAYLIGRGVPAGRIDTISFGKERPIASGSGESAFAQNRNAHTAIANQR
ncbi:peptidoglycan-associated lipoprotein Pal [Brevundimonas basaltis]|uniref:Peptidoglycan-associated lipoprotein n=1 Tax=Brevundimonas basaltis TaxID=472166 RepID=A0A7W8HX98_9CAUL|nr:peptidoglycan-associated lipoprotein Pal [Brevundimonas basaltis]MBB5290813.1 peptidoglycan-associated lipoprotein [Brevundimonas basaltis]